MDKDNKEIDAYAIAKGVVWAILVGVAAAALIENSAKADNLVLTTSSWHASNHDRGPRDSNFNETNWGLGYEYTYTPDNTWAFGFYKNSYALHSNYIVWMHQPYHWAVAGGDIKFGFFIGNITGYPKSDDTVTPAGIVIHSTEGRTWNPVAAPVLSYMYHGVGININIVPIPPLNRSAVLGFQLKVELP